MKNAFLTTIFLTLAIIQGYGQQQCDIKAQYENIFWVRKAIYNDQPYLIKGVVETPIESCLSDLVNSNAMFLDYLLTHFSSNDNYQNLLELTDSVAIRNKYFAHLGNDSLFYAVMTDLVNKTTDKEIAKDTLSMDELLNVAVKYFSIMKLTDEGHYVGKVCAGLNDIKKTEFERKPFVEAFSFSCILNHYHSDEYSMYDEFVKGIKELYKVNLGIDPNEKLLRAQGAMFLIMRNNDNLNKMLKSEYEKQKEFLPFVLAADKS